MIIEVLTAKMGCLEVKCIDNMLVENFLVTEEILWKLNMFQGVLEDKRQALSLSFVLKKIMLIFFFLLLDLSILEYCFQPNFYHEYQS